MRSTARSASPDAVAVADAIAGGPGLDHAIAVVRGIGQERMATVARWERPDEVERAVGGLGLWDPRRLPSAWEPDGWWETPVAKAARTTCTTVVGWSLPSRAAIEAIVRHVGPGNRIEDPCAGTGYWPAWLAASGLDVVAGDLMEPRFPVRHRWLPMAKHDLRAGRMDPDAALFLSWIPHGSDMADAAVAGCRPGTTIILVGEPDGCTGSATLHRGLDERTEILEEIPLPTWHGIDDVCSIRRVR